MMIHGDDDNVHCMCAKLLWWKKDWWKMRDERWKMIDDALGTSSAD
jgi:hypothetical protein